MVVVNKRPSPCLRGDRKGFIYWALLIASTAVAEPMTDYIAYCNQAVVSTHSKSRKPNAPFVCDFAGRSIFRENIPQMSLLEIELNFSGISD